MFLTYECNSFNQKTNYKQNPAHYIESIRYLFSVGGLVSVQSEMLEWKSLYCPPQNPEKQKQKNTCSSSNTSLCDFFQKLRELILIYLEVILSCRNPTLAFFLSNCLLIDSWK